MAGKAVLDDPVNREDVLRATFSRLFETWRKQEWPSGTAVREAFDWAMKHHRFESPLPKLESPKTVEERDGIERLTAQQLADYRTAAAEVRRQAAEARAAGERCPYLDSLTRIADGLDKAPHEITRESMAAE